MASERSKLSHDELRAAELGFRQLLRRKRFPAAFLDRHADDLLAQARLEYTKYIAGGGEVRNPPGWIIHCAWRRTQNLLEHESRVPGAVSIEDGAGLQSAAPTPEEETLEAARHGKVRAAVEALRVEERKVIALTYFEGMSVREASRVLGWDNCKGDRRHHSALTRLRELLGVKDAESLQIEIGVAAFSLLATGGLGRIRVPAFLHSAAEASVRGALELTGRAHELIRRVLSGGAVEGGVGAAGARSVEMGGGGVLAACAAGVCGAAAVTCLATGVLGPGVGAIGLSHSKPAQRAAKPQPITRSTEAKPSPEMDDRLRLPAIVAEAKRNELGKHAAKLAGAKRREDPKRAARESTSPSMAAAPEVAEEFDAYPEGGESSGSQSAPESSRIRPTGSGGGSAPPPQASGKEVEAEFAY